MIYRGRSRKRRHVQINDIMVYIPLLQTLQSMLKDEGIYTEVKIVIYMALHIYVNESWTTDKARSYINFTRNAGRFL